jgi:hypothetical protein
VNQAAQNSAKQVHHKATATHFKNLEDFCAQTSAYYYVSLNAFICGVGKCTNLRTTNQEYDLLMLLFSAPYHLENVSASELPN